MDQYKYMVLHPGAYKQMYPYLITINKNDRVQLRRFEIVSGHSKVVQIDEQKPGFN